MVKGGTSSSGKTITDWGRGNHRPMKERGGERSLWGKEWRGKKEGADRPPC